MPYPVLLLFRERPRSPLDS